MVSWFNPIRHVEGLRYPEHEIEDEIISRSGLVGLVAQECLRQAKKLGRNRLVAVEND